jgi:hypothetical protein
MSIKKHNEMRSILLKGFGYAQLLGRRRNEMKPAVLKMFKIIYPPCCQQKPLDLDCLEHLAPF